MQPGTFGWFAIYELPKRYFWEWISRLLSATTQHKTRKTLLAGWNLSLLIGESTFLTPERCTNETLLTVSDISTLSTLEQKGLFWRKECLDQCISLKGYGNYVSTAPLSSHLNFLSFRSKFTFHHNAASSLREEFNLPWQNPQDTWHSAP